MVIIVAGDRIALFIVLRLANECYSFSADAKRFKINEVQVELDPVGDCYEMTITELIIKIPEGEQNTARSRSDFRMKLSIKIIREIGNLTRIFNAELNYNL